MSAELSPEVALFLAEATTDNVKILPDGGIHIRNSETQYLIHRVAGGFVGEATSRGVGRSPDIRTSFYEVIERHLIMEYQLGWRRNHGLPSLVLGRPSDRQVPPGVSLVEDSLGKASLYWEANGVQYSAHELKLSWGAVPFARTLPYTLRELMDTFKNPVGLPIFPQSHI